LPVYIVNPTDTISATLRPSRLKTASLFLVCAAFVAGSVLMVRDGKTAGYFCGGFFALGLPIFAIQLHPKAAYLHIAPDGFTFCSLFRSHSIQWAHVQEFAVIQVGLNRMVAWNFTAEYPATGRARGFSKALCGYEAALPDTYRLKPQELADILNNLRHRNTCPHNA
jgi:hypothetical protein